MRPIQFPTAQELFSRSPLEDQIGVMAWACESQGVWLESRLADDRPFASEVLLAISSEGRLLGEAIVFMPSGPKEEAELRAFKTGHDGFDNVYRVSFDGPMFNGSDPSNDRAGMIDRLERFVQVAEHFSQTGKPVMNLDAVSLRELQSYAAEEPACARDLVRIVSIQDALFGTQNRALQDYRTMLSKVSENVIRLEDRRISLSSLLGTEKPRIR